MFIDLANFTVTQGNEMHHRHEEQAKIYRSFIKLTSSLLKIINIVLTIEFLSADNYDNRFL